MKFYKPTYSIIIIAIQLVLSIISYSRFVKWGEANPEFCQIYLGNSLFLFVLIIGIYEMQTKPNWFKKAIRVLLMGIVLGTQFADLIPINQFYFGVYNTAWFSATVAALLILFSIVKHKLN